MFQEREYYWMGEDDWYLGYPPATFDELGLDPMWFNDYVLYENYLDGYYGYHY